MRKLACFSFAFAAGALLFLAELPGALLLAAAALLLLLFLGGVLLRRDRRGLLAALLSAGLLCGLGWTAAYDALLLQPARSLQGEYQQVSVELTGYPVATDYGCSVEGRLQGARSVRILLYLDEEGDWKPGDVISGEGALCAADQSGDSHYYQSVGILLKGYLHGDIQTEICEKMPLWAFPAKVSHALKAAVEQLFPTDVQGYFRALLTGDKSGISYGEKTNLQIAGIYHAMAVSGMHVAILMSLLRVLTLHHQRLYPAIGLPVLAFYCVLMGGVPSVVRAAVMQAFLLAAPLFRREPDTPTALGTALLLLTAENPGSLLNIGLQLSFLATLGIILFSHGIYDCLRARRPSRIRALWNGALRPITVSAGALVLTLPLMAYSFGIVSLFSVLTNLLTLEALTVGFALGLLAAGFFFLTPGFANVLAAPAALLLRYVVWVADRIAAIPFAALYGNTPFVPLFLLFLYGLLLLLLLRRKQLSRRVALVSGSCAAVLLCLCLLLSWNDGRDGSFTFTALDVGQGQSLLVQSGGVSAAIDCGSRNGDDAGEQMAEALLSAGSTRLDYLILTHYDDDHTGGVPQLFQRVAIGTLLLPDLSDDSGIREELETMASAAGTQVCYVTADEAISFGSGTLQIFAPVSSQGGNASCLSILASFGSYDILVTGDLGTSQENALLASHTLPDLELLVAGHHGSAYSTGAELLAETQPETVIISVGPNAYGHPAEETLDRITAAGAGILRTDENGTITIRG